MSLQETKALKKRYKYFKEKGNYVINDSKSVRIFIHKGLRIVRNLHILIYVHQLNTLICI
jgi:hypothetical protein